MELLAAFPDAELVVMALLELLAPGRTVTSTPADLGAEPVQPVIRVQRIGGNDDGITDRPRVEVSTFAATRGEAQQLQMQCQQRILAAGCTTVDLDEVDAVLIDTASTDTGPIQPPRYTNPDVRWVPAFYRFAWRRPAAT